MKILANFDRAIADVLQEKVKARLTFKVGATCCEAGEPSACLETCRAGETCAVVVGKQD